MPKDVGATLKKLRVDAGFSVKEISDILITKGFKAGESTVYSWENNNSQPTPGALLTMCKAYNVSDVLSTFGYGEFQIDGSLSFSDDEIEMIKKTRCLDEHGKRVVTLVLDEEYARCSEEYQNNKVVELSFERGSGKLVARNGRDLTKGDKEEILNIAKRWQDRNE